MQYLVGLSVMIIIIIIAALVFPLTDFKKLITMRNSTTGHIEIIKFLKSKSIKMYHISRFVES